jgi:hypothetical protein
VPKIIYPRELWPIQKLQSIPELIVPPESFSKEQTDDLTLSVQILQLLYKPDRSRRTTIGLNRAAQYQWPDLRIEIGFIEDILDAWAIAGAKGLIDLIAEGNVDCGPSLGPRNYGRIHHSLSELAVVLVEAEKIGDKEEVFVLPSYLVERMEGRDPGWNYYRIAVETNYGVFKFAVLSHEVPNWQNVAPYCIWHTAIRIYGVIGGRR